MSTSSRYRSAGVEDGTEPTDFLASGSIEAACYRGTRLSSDDLLHAERVSDQVDASLGFVAKFMRTAAPEPAGARDANHDIDVVDEAVVNARRRRAKAFARSSATAKLAPDGFLSTTCSATTATGPVERARIATILVTRVTA